MTRIPPIPFKTVGLCLRVKGGEIITAVQVSRAVVAKVESSRITRHRDS